MMAHRNSRAHAAAAAANGLDRKSAAAVGIDSLDAMAAAQHSAYYLNATANGDGMAPAHSASCGVTLLARAQTAARSLYAFNRAPIMVSSTAGSGGSGGNAKPNRTPAAAATTSAVDLRSPAGAAAAATASVTPSHASSSLSHSHSPAAAIASSAAAAIAAAAVKRKAESELHAASAAASAFDLAVLKRAKSDTASVLTALQLCTIPTLAPESPILALPNQLEALLPRRAYYYAPATANGSGVGAKSLPFPVPAPVHVPVPLPLPAGTLPAATNRPNRRGGAPYHPTLSVAVPSTPTAVMVTAAGTNTPSALTAAAAFAAPAGATTSMGPPLNRTVMSPLPTPSPRVVAWTPAHLRSPTAHPPPAASAAPAAAAAMTLDPLSRMLRSNGYGQSHTHIDFTLPSAPAQLTAPTLRPPSGAAPGSNKRQRTRRPSSVGMADENGVTIRPLVTTSSSHSLVTWSSANSLITAASNGTAAARRTRRQDSITGLNTSSAPPVDDSSDESDSDSDHDDGADASDQSVAIWFQPTASGDEWLRYEPAAAMHVLSSPTLSAAYAFTLPIHRFLEQQTLAPVGTALPLTTAAPRASRNRARRQIAGAASSSQPPSRDWFDDAVALQSAFRLSQLAGAVLPPSQALGSASAAAASDDAIVSSSQLEYLPEPMILVGVDSEWRAVRHSAAIDLWESLNFEPYSSPKHVSFLVVPPPPSASSSAAGDGALNYMDGVELASFFDGLGVMYETCHLGRHRSAVGGSTAAANRSPLLVLPEVVAPFRSPHATPSINTPYGTAHPATAKSPYPYSSPLHGAYLTSPGAPSPSPAGSSAARSGAGSVPRSHVRTGSALTQYYDRAFHAITDALMSKSNSANAAIASTSTAASGTGFGSAASTAGSANASNTASAGVDSSDAVIVYVLCSPDRPHDLKLWSEYWGALRSSIENQHEHNLMSSRRASGLHLDSGTVICQFIPSSVVSDLSAAALSSTYRQLALGVYNKVCRPLLKIERFLNPEEELPATFDRFWEPAYVLATEHALPLPKIVFAATPTTGGAGSGGAAARISPNTNTGASAVGGSQTANGASPFVVGLSPPTPPPLLPSQSNAASAAAAAAVLTTSGSGGPAFNPNFNPLSSAPPPPPAASTSIPIVPPPATASASAASLPIQPNASALRTVHVCFAWSHPGFAPRNGAAPAHRVPTAAAANGAAYMCGVCVDARGEILKTALISPPPTANATTSATATAASSPPPAASDELLSLIARFWSACVDPVLTVLRPPVKARAPNSTAASSGGNGSAVATAAGASGTAAPVPLFQLVITKLAVGDGSGGAGGSDDSYSALEYAVWERFLSERGFTCYSADRKEEASAVAPTPKSADSGIYSVFLVSARAPPPIATPHATAPARRSAAASASALQLLPSALSALAVHATASPHTPSSTLASSASHGSPQSPAAAAVRSPLARALLFGRSTVRVAAPPFGAMNPVVMSDGASAAASTSAVDSGVDSTTIGWRDRLFALPEYTTCDGCRYAAASAASAAVVTADAANANANVNANAGMAALRLALCGFFTAAAVTASPSATTAAASGALRLAVDPSFWRLCLHRVASQLNDLSYLHPATESPLLRTPVPPHHSTSRAGGGLTAAEIDFCLPLHVAMTARLLSLIRSIV